MWDLLASILRSFLRAPQITMGVQSLIESRFNCKQPIAIVMELPLRLVLHDDHIQSISLMQP